MDRKSKIVLAGFGVVILALIGWNFYYNTPPEAWISSGEKLPNNQVCMVNDAYMGIDQIEVPVGDQMYYGCCEMCVTKLQTIDEIRFSVDPVSLQKVNKSTAYIILDPNSKQNSVIYFENETNAQKYLTRR